MHVKVYNYRRCADADFDIERIALILGRNSEGKSSLLQATALALTHTPLPYGLAKGAAAAVVNDAAKVGFVEVVTEDGGQIKIGWPGATVEESGRAPKATPYATGLASLVYLEDKERADVLVRLIKALPTKDDLGAALLALGMKQASIDRIWTQIEAQGWGVAFKDAEETRASRKGEYQQITGQNWGADKGASYQPADFTEDLEGAAEADLDQAVTLSRAKLEDAIKAQGADEGEKARLQGIADMLPTLQENLAAAETELSTKAKAVVEAQKERDALPKTAATGTKAAEPDTCACPACGVLLEIRVSGGGLAPTYGLVENKTDAKPKPAKVDPELGKKIAGADGALSKAQADRMTAQTSMHQISASIGQAQEAERKLADMTSAAGSAEATAEAREAVALAERRVTAWRKRRDARAKHAAIMNWDNVAKILAPTGLRQKKLTESLDAFNSKLRELCETAAWPIVSVAVDKGVTFKSNGRDYRLIGDNEQFRVRAVLACAHAMFDGSDLVIVDSADILDMPSRGGLLKMVEATGKPALIAMTVTLPRNKAPDLAKAGRGGTYVIEGGKLRPYDAAKDEAA